MTGRETEGSGERERKERERWVPALWTQREEGQVGGAGGGAAAGLLATHLQVEAAAAPPPRERQHVPTILRSETKARSGT
jgi:hypothetical protein